MAVLARTSVNGASPEALGQIAQRIESAMEERGGPPAGLMVAIVHPEGEGVVVSEVWRSEPEMREWTDAVLLPAIVESGCSAEPTTVAPVLSFARP